LEEFAVWTRNILILSCCLLLSLAASARGSAPGYAEVVATPAASSPDIYSPVSDDSPSGESCGSQYPPRPTPWYYWWLSYHGRGGHYAYLPPVPGWYYFRPYSLEQQRAQQRAVQVWGGDPRNPYSNVEFQQVYPRVEGRPAPAYR
jgi:hypothetical protein